MAIRWNGATGISHTGLLGQWIVNFDNEFSDANANRVEFVNPKKRQHSETEECTDIVNDDNEFSEADSLD